MKKFIMLFTLIMGAASLNAAAADYTMEDLRALHRDGYWEELLDSAKSIKPSERNDEWKRLVSEAAEKYMAQQKGDDYSGYKGQELLDRYPFLSGNKGFTAAADDGVMKDLEACVENTDSGWGYEGCFEQYKSDAERNPPSGETAIKAANLISKYSNPGTVVEYYELAVKQGNQYCADANLVKATESGLVAASYSKTAASARNIAFKLCKNEMAQVVSAAKARETATETQRKRHFMQNYCVFNDTEECRKADF